MRPVRLMFSVIKRFSLACPPALRWRLLLTLSLLGCATRGYQPPKLPGRQGAASSGRKTHWLYCSPEGGWCSRSCCSLVRLISWGGTWLGLNSIRLLRPVSGRSCHAFRWPRAAPAPGRGTRPFGATLTAQAPPATAGTAIAPTAAGSDGSLGVLYHLEQLA